MCVCVCVCVCVCGVNKAVTAWFGWRCRGVPEQGTPTLTAPGDRPVGPARADTGRPAQEGGNSINTAGREARSEVTGSQTQTHQHETPDSQTLRSERTNTDGERRELIPKTRELILFFM